MTAKNTRGNRKLTDSHAQQIQLLKSRGRTNKQLADLFKVSPHTISQALKRDLTTKLSDFAVMR